MSEYPFAGLILDAESGIVALKKLLVLRKAEDNKITLAWLSRKLQIKSKSYLSEALNGKKVLKWAHVDALIAECQLKILEAKLLKARIVSEAKSTKDKERELAKAEIAQLRKQLNATQFSIADLGDFRIAALVLVSFYLFKNHEASRTDIVKLFGKAEAFNIDRALYQLVTMKALAQKEDRYLLVENLAVSALAFAEGDTSKEKDFLRSCFQEGLKTLDDRYDDTELSCFFSSCVTVNIPVYKDKLNEFRNLMRSFITDLDTKNPDCVARINIQMYPILVKS